MDIYVNKDRCIGRVIGLIGLIGVGWTCRGATPVEVVLAEGGQAKQQVVVADGASREVSQAAKDLANYLGKIAGASFVVGSGDGTTGLAVGTVKDFPALQVRDVASGTGLSASERYCIRTHAGGAYLIGATDLAVQHAVWDFLHHLGYRQYFPTAKWEIVPRRPDLKAALDVLTQPAYAGRGIWFGYGAWPALRERYGVWCARNRMSARSVINTGHAYEAIISRNQAEFDAHPEYLGLVGDRRTSTKFCIGNPEVRKLVADDALRQFEKSPNLASVSVEPSDGGGWCQCEACAALGKVSDRQATLANEVAEAVGRRFPGKLVCFYAYNEHSPAPEVPIASNVIVSIATAFVKGGFSVDQLFDGWSRVGANLGVREYYAVNVWDRDLPGRGRGSNIAYLQRTLCRFHACGARFMSSESGDNWGPNGLGYYLASRMLWDTNEAGRVEALSGEFVADCFGPAREPMREFYRLLDGAQKLPLTSDLIGRLFRALQQARQLAAGDAAIGARLDDLALYMQYVELFRVYQEASGGGWRPGPAVIGGKDEAPKPPRQAAFEALIRFAYRIRDTQMIHSLALIRDLPGRDGSVWMHEEAQFNAPEIIKQEQDTRTANWLDETAGQEVTGDLLAALLVDDAVRTNAWKRAEPFSQPEIAAMIEAGVAKNQLIDFTPVAFSDELVPARGLDLAVPAGNAPPRKEADERASTATRGLCKLYFWPTNTPFDVTLKVTAGLIYNCFGDTTVKLFPAAETTGAAVDSVSVAPDQVTRTITLKSTYEGLHRIEWSDRAAKTRIDWPAGFGGTWTCSESEPFKLAATQIFFYVPRGTRIIGGRSNAGMTFVNPAGKAAGKVENRSALEYFTIPVEPGMDGRLWAIRDLRGGTLALLTVPPWLAFNPTDLLLPIEVVQTDAK